MWCWFIPARGLALCCTNCQHANGSWCCAFECCCRCCVLESETRVEQVNLFFFQLQILCTGNTRLKVKWFSSHIFIPTLSFLHSATYVVDLSFAHHYNLQLKAPSSEYFYLVSLDLSRRFNFAFLNHCISGVFIVLFTFSTKPPHDNDVCPTRINLHNHFSRYLGFKGGVKIDTCFKVWTLIQAISTT